MAHAFYWLTHNTKLKNQFDDLTKLSGLVATLGHDLGHRGKNNGYEVNSMSTVALKYHDNSVLEQYHIFLLMQILSERKSNILMNLHIEEWRNARRTIIECIMSTDMAKHKPLLEEFDNNMTDYKSKTEFSRDEQIKIASVFTHICDLSGPAKKSDIAFTWSNLVRKEFMQQVADEKKNNLPVTPFMVGLENQAKYLKGEMFFLKCIVIHLFGIGNEYLDGELDFVMNILNKNYEETEQLWKEEDEKE